MTEVETARLIQEHISSEGLNAKIDDDAFLMTMVETDSLLPANMTFSGLFENENELNPEELSDIASLLAPQVSDDEAGGSSETNSPVSVKVTTTASVGGIPILPKLEKTPAAAVVSPVPQASLKRTITLQDSATAPPQKKAKAASSAITVITAMQSNAQSLKINLKPKPAVLTGPPASMPTLSKSDPSAPNPLSGDENKRPALPTLAPKPGTTKAVPSVVIKKSTGPVASSSIKSVIAPSNKDQVNHTPNKTTTAKAVDKPETESSSSRPLTDEERAQQCRDRNRQHARNTRLRKKAYVEELKQQLRDMVEERDARLFEEAQKTKIVEQQREVRFQVMQDFLQLRGRNEGNPHRWGAILEDGFSLTLPKTYFQTMVEDAADVPTPLMESKSQQILCGVNSIMADATHFASFLQSFAASTTYTYANTHPSGDDTSIPIITFVYHCDRRDFLMDGSTAILNWTATSVGAVQAGAHRELELCGSMRARFCDQTNRLEQAHILFDTGLVRSQLSVF